jgi:outer membrane receptor protein involved in Fe transport
MWTAPASAQEQTQPQAAAEAPADDKSGEILVTARRRAERLIDVPVAATTLGGEALGRYATTDLTSVATQVPQLKIDRVGFGNGAIINIRGVGSSAVDAAIEQEVTVNIDGIPISRGRVVTQALFDIQSIEVLKGPQALFFGKNSPAGVITVNSTNPGHEVEGYIKAGYETTAQEYSVEGAVTLPLSDAFRIRVAGRFSNMMEGFITNDAGPITDPALLPAQLVAAGLTLPGAPERDLPGTRDRVVRLTALYDPGTGFDANFKFLYSKHMDDGYAQGTIIFSCGPGQTNPSTLDLGAAVPKYLLDPYGRCTGPSTHSSVGTVPAAIAARYPASNGGVPYVDVDTYLSSLTLNYALTDDLKLTSVSGYYKYQENGWGAFDYTTLAIASGKNDDGQRSISQELRLQSSFSTPLNFTLGLYYGNDKRSYFQAGTIGYFGIDPVTGRTDTTSSDSSFTGKTYSAFGQLTWNLTPTVELSGGARYTHERKTGNMGNVYLHAARAASFLPITTRLIGAFTEENVSPEVTMSWHPAPDVLLYGSFKTGFKSGGFSSPTRYPANATLANQTFGQETVHGFEGGMKFSTLDRRLTGDLGIYDYTYKGLQLTAYDGTTSSYFTQNAGSASVRGVEMSLNFRVSDAFALRGSGAYNHARYASFPGSQCFTGQTAAEGCVAAKQSLTGQPLSRAPDWTLQGGATWTVPIGADWKFSASGDVRYTSKYFISTNNSPFALQPGFTMLDLSAKVYSADWELALVGKNLTNRIYGVVGNDKPLGPRGQVSANIGRPREILVQLTRHF